MILGLGNPLLDICVSESKDLLEKYNLQVDDAILAEKHHLPIYEEILARNNVELIAGGSTLNTIRITQWFFKNDNVCTYIGCVGKDNYAEILRDICQKQRIRALFSTHPSMPTGTCAVLTNEKNRSMIANLSSATMYSIRHLETSEIWKYVENAKLIYSAGYFLTSSPDSSLKVAKHCSDQNKIFSMNISAPFIPHQFKQQILNVLPYCDIIFGNKDEALALADSFEYKTTDLQEIALKLHNHEKVNPNRSRLVIFTQGADNTLVFFEGKMIEYPVIPLQNEEIIDTNGAGDAFVGGFLSKFVLNNSIDECVACAHYASHVLIQQSGCSLPNGIIPHYSQ